MPWLTHTHVHRLDMLTQPLVVSVCVVCVCGMVCVWYGMVCVWYGVCGGGVCVCLGEEMHIWEGVSHLEYFAFFILNLLIFL